MKKILVRGKRVFRATCDICGCEFVYDLDELIHDSYTSFVKGVNCPCCEHHIPHDGPEDVGVMQMDEVFPGC